MLRLFAMSLSSSLTLLSILTSSLLLSLSESKSSLPLANGLSWTFYESTCPKMESIVRRRVMGELSTDIGLAAGLLRIHYHDCFVQGCDGSVLLVGTEQDPSEQASAPNLSLRPKALALINELQDLIEKECGPVVSCADIAAAAARDSVFLSRGPFYDIPYGRRDSLTFASDATTLASLPSPFLNVTALIASFSTNGLNAADLVALSGAHTIGLADCPTFTNRLYPSQDPTLNPPFAEHLYDVCPTRTSSNTTVLDIRTPNAFDNKYYINLVEGEGLFTSDEGLFGDERTKRIVEDFARDGGLFFEKFAEAMVKMGQVSVLTGVQGEIRRDCTVPNAGLATVNAEGAVEGFASV